MDDDVTEGGTTMGERVVSITISELDGARASMKVVHESPSGRRRVELRQGSAAELRRLARGLAARHDLEPIGPAAGTAGPDVRPGIYRARSQPAA